MDSQPFAATVCNRSFGFAVAVPVARFPRLKSLIPRLLFAAVPSGTLTLKLGRRWKFVFFASCGRYRFLHVACSWLGAAGIRILHGRRNTSNARHFAHYALVVLPRAQKFFWPHHLYLHVNDIGCNVRHKMLPASKSLPS